VPLVPSSAVEGSPSLAGNGNDWVAKSPSGSLISSSYGSFPSVTGLTSESSPDGANYYTLQDNTNTFATSTTYTGGRLATGWEQFVFLNYPAYDVGVAFMQYWLLGYLSQYGSCPSTGPPSGTSWMSYEGSCYANGPEQAEIPLEAATSLGALSLETYANYPSGYDQMGLCTGTTCYLALSNSQVLDLYQNWQYSEFNVVGDGGGSEASFNPGTTITVSNSLNAVPSCSTTEPIVDGYIGFTGETNNLDLGSCSTNGDAIVFPESNAVASPTISTAVQPSASVAVGTSTHDTATVGGTLSGFVPAGTVTYTLYSTGGACSGPSSTQRVTLNPDGTVPPSSSQTLGAGSYSYSASYSGDPNYEGETSTCEPLTVTSSTVAGSIRLSVAESGAPDGTFGLSGCGVSVSSVPGDGSAHSFTATPNCLITVTAPAAGSSTRSLFAGSSTAESFTTCATGTCPEQDYSYYYQLGQSVSLSILGGGSPSVTLTSVQFGASTPTTLATAPANIWVDFGTAASVPVAVAGAAGEQWVTSTSSWTITSSDAITIPVVYQHQYQVSFAVSPTAGGTTTPSGLNVWEDAGSLSISASPNGGYTFSSWGSSTGSITFAGPTSASTTAAVSGSGTITADFTAVGPTALSLDGSVSGGANFGTTVSVSLTTSCSPDVVIVLIGENTARATATAATPESTGLSFELRSSLQSGTVRLWEYYAIANSPLTSQLITETMSQQTAFTVTAFGVCGADTGAPFDTNSQLPKTTSGFWGTSHSNSVTTSGSDDFVFDIDASQGNPAYTTLDSYASILTQQVPSWMASSTEYKVVSSPQSGTTLGFTLSVGQSGSQVVDAIVAASTSTTTVTQPIAISIKEPGAPSATFTINGCGASPSTIPGDGASHPITMQASCPFTLSYANSGTSRYGFITGGSFSAASPSETTCSSGTCTGISLGYDLQEQLTVSGGFGVSYSLPSETNDGWYRYGDGLTVSSNGINARSGGAGMRVTGWQIDAGTTNGVATTGLVTTSSITMGAPHTVTFNAVAQYQVTLDSGATSALASITPSTIPGDSYWYDSTTHVTLVLDGIWGATTVQRDALLSYSVDGGSPTSTATTGTVTVLSALPIASPQSITTTSTVQYSQSVSLSILGGGSPSVTLTSVQFGASTPTTLATTTVTVWMDSGAIASIPAAVAGAAGEQWVTSTVSWTITASDAITNPIVYQHQYQVTFAVSPSGDGTTTPSGSNVWEDAGSLPISASPNGGYAFSSWSSSTGSITFASSTSASTTATVSGPGTITSDFTVVTSTVTQPITCTVANSGPAGTMTLSGAGVSPTTLPCDGTSHSFTANPSSTITVTVPTDATNARYRFAGGSSTTTIATCASGTCTGASITAYYQLKNTYQATPQTPTAWDAALSIGVTGTQAGAPAQVGCTIATTNGGEAANCAAWFDYDAGVTVASPVSVSGTEQWAQSGGDAFTQATGGNTDDVNYLDQFAVTFAVSPAGAGTTSPSGTNVFEAYGALSIGATPNSGYVFSSWSSNVGGITFASAGSASTTITVHAAGTITAAFGTGTTTLSLDGSASGGANLGTTVSVPLTTSCSPDVVVVLVGENTARATATASTPTSSGLTFALRASLQSGTMRLWEYYAIASGPLASQSITETMSQQTAFTVTAFGVCGADTATPFDSSAQLPKTTSGFWGTSHSNSVTTSGSDDFVFDIDASQGNPAYTPLNGYASILTQQVPSWMASSTEYKVVSSPQSGTTLGFTLSVGQSGSQVVDAIVAASSPGLAAPSSGEAPTSPSIAAWTSLMAASRDLPSAAYGSIPCPTMTHVEEGQEQPKPCVPREAEGARPC
jgi:hypothetical protein